jgi:hypothetical protein
MRLVLACAGAAATLALTGCGGSGATDVLSQTADNLSKIRSGTLTLRLLVTPTKGQPFGFRLHGPFSLGKAGSLPVLHVAYTQIASGNSATVTVISDGSRAYVASAGREVALDSVQTQALRQANSQVGGKNGLESFGIGNWFVDPKRSDGGRVGGADTDKVSAKLDVVEATNGLLSLLRQGGRDVPTIRGAEAKRLRDAVRSSSIEVYSGKKDHLLRRMSMRVAFGLDVPRTLRAALGRVVGAHVRFELGVDRPNRPVHVSAP